MVTTIEVSIDDNDWPQLKLIIKEGTHVQTAAAMRDTAGSHFESKVHNALQKVLVKINQTKGVK